MSRRSQLIGAAILAGLGILIVLGMVFLSEGSVREYVAERYTRTSSDDPALAGALVYTSTRSAAVVTNEITSAWKPADRHTDPAGYFLRYRDDIIAVSPTASGGSRIVVDDGDRGYTRWYGFVGGYWGTYSGPAEGLRGGGPGAGK